MKESRYNYHVSSADSYYVFNTRYQSFAQLTSPDALMHEDNRELAFQQGFIIADDLDEGAEVMREVLEKINSPLKELDVTLVLTEACNFRCIYCYQEEKTQNAFSQEDEDRFIRFLRQAHAQGLEEVRVHYFGGEPLLNLPRLYSLHTQLQRLSQETGLKYKSHITTNGSMLTPQVMRDFEVTGLQLTFDGDAAWHNQYKVSSDFDYDQLLERVEQVLSLMPKTQLRIRMNFSKENAESFDAVFDDLFALPHFDMKRVDFSLQPLRRCNPTMPFTALEPEEFADHWTRYRRKLEKMGVEFAMPPALSQPCPFSTGRALVLKPGFQICSCLSDYQEGLSLEGLPERVRQGKLTYEPDDSCMTCEVFPLCLGGCRVKKPGEGGCCIWKHALYDYLLDHCQEGGVA